MSFAGVLSLINLTNLFKCAQTEMEPSSALHVQPVDTRLVCRAEDTATGAEHVK